MSVVQFSLILDEIKIALSVFLSVYLLSIYDCLSLSVPYENRYDIRKCQVTVKIVISDLVVLLNEGRQNDVSLCMVKINCTYYKESDQIKKHLIEWKSSKLYHKYVKYLDLLMLNNNIIFLLSLLPLLSFRKEYVAETDQCTKQEVQ